MCKTLYGIFQRFFRLATLTQNGMEMLYAYGASGFRWLLPGLCGREEIKVAYAEGLVAGSDDVMTRDVYWREGAD